MRAWDHSLAQFRHSAFKLSERSVVEGPSPEFVAVRKDWTASLAEGQTWSVVAMCEMRTFDGRSLVDRCVQAWEEGRPARLDYPVEVPASSPPGGRAEVEIVAAYWEQVEEGQRLILWVKMDDVDEIAVDQGDSVV